VRVCAFVCVCLCVSVCVCVCLCVKRLFACASRLCGPSHGDRRYLQLGARTAAMCALRAALAIGRFACVHAGATWTSRTTSAPWAARYAHTTVIDAAGAIYVIGGYGSGSTRYQDVWASIDGGADLSRSRALDGAPATCPRGCTFWHTLCTLRVPKYPSRTPTNPSAPGQYPRKYPGTTEVP
jgi:hypothetical protein